MSIKNYSKEQIVDFFSMIIRIRMIEQSIADRYHLEEMKCPMHLSIGQEGPAAAIAMCLNPEDKMLSTHRSHAHYLAKGGSLNGMIAEMFGKNTGCSGGMGGSMHLIDKSCGFEGATAIVGNTIPIATGVAFAQKIAKSNLITVVCLGEGATEEGVFSESLNLASLKKLPMIFLVENNNFSVYTPLSERQSKNRSIVKISEAHGIKSFVGNGNFVEEVLSVSSNATEYVRKFGLPALIEFKTYRYLEHCGPNKDDDLCYRSKEEIRYWHLNDVIMRTSELLDNMRVDATNLREDIQKRVTNEIDLAFKLAVEAKTPTLKGSARFEYA